MSGPLEFTLNGRPVRVEGVSPNTTLPEFFARQRADRLEGRLRRGRLRRVLRRHCQARRGRQTGVSNQQSPAIVVREFRSGINHGEFHERGGNVCKRKLPKRLGWFLKSRRYRKSICCGGLSKQCLPFGPFAKNFRAHRPIGSTHPTRPLTCLAAFPQLRFHQPPARRLAHAPDAWPTRVCVSGP